MKGLELPINLLVVVAVAIIVLLGVIGLFLAGFFGGGQNLQLTTAKNSACSILIQSGCQVTNTLDIPVDFDADNNESITFDNKVTDPDGTGPRGPGDNLFILCQNYFSAITDANCKKNVCNCI